jgi:hypothetical protein
MLATAGKTRFWATQLMPAMTPEVLPDPVHPSTRTACKVTPLATPKVAAAHGARYMGAVTVAVVGPLAVGDGGVPVADATGKLRMRRPDAGVDDIGVDAGAGDIVGVGSVERAVQLVDPIQSPRRIRLGGIHQI